MTRVLAYIPSPPRGVWHLGLLPIRAYALFIIVGIVVALMIGDRRWEARGGQRGVIYDIALWAVPFGLVGGRLYHLATDWRTYWGPGGAGFGAALRIWDGGLGIWGAVALGGVGAWIACRRRGIPLPAFGDAIAPGIVLAQAIGRLGNYFNQELYGRETTVPWGLEIFYRRDPSGYVDPHSLDGVSTGQVAFVVQPTFLYELIWNVLVFVALIYVDRRFKFGHGRLFALYVAAYCVGRFGVELLRNDTATLIAGIRINVFTSTFVFIGAVVYIILAPKGREDPATLRGKDYVAEEAPPPEPEAEEEPERITGPSVAAAAAVAGAAAAGRAASRLIPRRRPAPVTAAEAEAEAETVKADAEVPVTAAPEAEEPETADAEVPPAAAEAEEPATARAEAAESEAEEPETAPAEAAATEAEEPEPEAAEAAAGKEPEPEAAEEPEEAEASEPEVAEAETAVAEAEESEPTEPGGEETEASEAVAAEAEEAAGAEPEAQDLEAEATEPKGQEPEADSEPEDDTEKPAEDSGAGTSRRRLSFRLRNRRDP
ncbi:prolipoprotein diacylglyceryl transferase [Mycobacterium sp. E2699]|uniref:prolipoprotein diacylglyceryl transferase n=1 Tax=Mycobacterium sp. E2699 TaxID=1834137 RepID=UPI0007FE42E4|nr:prolipoprotein diacylglyceryl transferase [Mycobacterium sp. E2699]OBH04086.1 prolipoprotein diacylglyceryl transferase [Mycobacterium sp. E2699]